VKSQWLLEVIKVNSALRDIGFSRNFIGDEGAQRIADALKMNTTLHKIGVEGAKWIAEAIKVNTTLQSINLCKNKLGSEGAKWIAEAIKEITA
jgi:Ran GTPase-activating protein (RanGAP) involved in mRNA processing and transport